MQLPQPLIKNVVLVGGGHAHALVLRSWAMQPVAGVQLTVVNPSTTAPYTGMLPGYVAGHYSRKDLDIDLVQLSQQADARLVLGSVTAIDRHAKTVTVTDSPPLPYDICSINVGITSAMPELAGFVEHGVPAKPLDRFAVRWTEFVDEVKQPQGAETPSVVVIGGGVAGCELALAMQHRLRATGVQPKIVIVDASDILSELGERSRTGITQRLANASIVVHEHTLVQQVTEHSVELADGTVVTADLVVGAAGARPYPWLQEIDVDTNRGFITIDNTLRSVSDPNIFAVGDCAHMGFAPRPKAGVFAVRQAPVLFANIAAVVTDRELETYAPQDDYLKLISLGSKTAAADKFKRLVQGKALWRLKDSVDRRFMNKLNSEQ